MVKNFFSFLYKKEKEESWFSFVVFRLSALVLLLFSLDLCLPTEVEMAEGSDIHTTTYRNTRTHSRFKETSMQMNGRAVYDSDAVQKFIDGDSVYLHRSYVFGFIKAFHVEGDRPQIWVNGFSPLRVFCFVPILMFICFVVYFASSYYYDFDFMFKISVLNLILTIVLFLFMIHA